MQAIAPELRDDIRHLVGLLIAGRFTDASATADSRLTPDEMREAMALTGEDFTVPTEQMLDAGRQLGSGAGAEVFVPFWTEAGEADLELQLRVQGPESRRPLLVWDILVP